MSKWEHTRDEHQVTVGSDGVRDDYKVSVEGRFQKCLYRQVDDDVRMKIFKTSGGVLRN